LNQLQDPEALKENGFAIKNDVCFNQVLVSLGDSDLTEKTLKFIQESNECWCGGAKWEGEAVICSILAVTNKNKPTKER